jgi:hypothetical protein
MNISKIIYYASFIANIIFVIIGDIFGYPFAVLNVLAAVFMVFMYDKIKWGNLI